MVCYLYRGRCPRLLRVVPSRHRSACGSFFTTDYADRTDECPMAWQSSNTIRAGQMLHIALCCLEGSTPEEREGLSLFIALRWMQDREGVMVWLTENIQACLRILRRHSTNGSQETSCINRKGFIWFLSYGQHSQD